MAFWHGRILPATLYFRDRGIVVITSANFDGEWIAASSAASATAARADRRRAAARARWSSCEELMAEGKRRGVHARRPARPGPRRAAGRRLPVAGHRPPDRAVPHRSVARVDGEELGPHAGAEARRDGRHRHRRALRRDDGGRRRRTRGGVPRSRGAPRRRSRRGRSVLADVARASAPASAASSVHGRGRQRIRTLADAGADRGGARCARTARRRRRHARASRSSLPILHLEQLVARSGRARLRRPRASGDRRRRPTWTTGSRAVRPALRWRAFLDGQRHGHAAPSLLAGEASDAAAGSAAISSPLRTSSTSPTTTGWFQVLPSRPGTRAELGELVGRRPHQRQLAFLGAPAARPDRRAAPAGRCRSGRPSTCACRRRGRCTAGCCRRSRRRGPCGRRSR